MSRDHQYVFANTLIYREYLKSNGIIILDSKDSYPLLYIRHGYAIPCTQGALQDIIFSNPTIGTLLQNYSLKQAYLQWFIINGNITQVTDPNLIYCSSRRVPLDELINQFK